MFKLAVDSEKPKTPIVPMFISIDPDRDTVDVVSKYVKGLYNFFVFFHVFYLAGNTTFIN